MTVRKTAVAGGGRRTAKSAWRALISDPQFTLRRDPNPNLALALIFPNTPDGGDASPATHVVVSFDRSSPPLRTLDIRAGGTSLRHIESSCNGLLLCKPSETDTRCWVSIPATNQHALLPEINFDHNNLGTLRMSLAYDPVRWSPRDYKVVCVNPCAGRASIYSSRAGSWEKQGNPFGKETMDGVDFRKGVYWNGAVHWVGFGKHGKCAYMKIDGEKDNEKTLEVMPNPPPIVKSNCSWSVSNYFGESRGRLQYVNWTESSSVSSVCLDVHEMRRDYSEWYFRYRIEVPVDSGGRCWYNVCNMVAAGEDRVDVFLFLRGEGVVTKYDVVRGSFQNVKIACESKAHVMFPYIETVCCV
ncbi:F-box family protein [Striga asiatica]|uniref:F-box family protein n=1 Tax=Striga asiatica TaxID=4170 RepID=A0A5A7R0B9_STRAF|nr:F-box family protein [Striga asiatica]